MSVVGIDLGIRKIAMSCISEGSEDAWAYEAPAAHRAVQLLEVASMAHDFCLLHNATSVWIEDVIVGNNRKYSIGLAQTMGAVVADLASLYLQEGLDIRTVDNKVWKKAVVGNGNAPKPAVREYIESTHPQYAPLCGQDEDLYDATCIGLYGSRILTRARDLQL